MKLGAGLTAAGAVLATASNAQVEELAADRAKTTAEKIKAVDDAETAKAGGTWQAKVTLLNGTAAPVTAVDHSSQSVKTAASTSFLLNVLKGLSGYHDGFRRNMSSVERSRIAMKYGADDANRNEAGVVYNAAGAPALVYAFMSQFDDHWGDYGATHPAVQAHAAMGRKMLDIVNSAGTAATDAVTLDAEEAGTAGLAG